MDIRYIDAQEVIKEVKNELSSWFEKGALDESYLYPVIRACLGKMGLRILPVKQEIVKVEDFQADLPCDFYKLATAIGCGMEEWYDVDYSNSSFVEYQVSGLQTCECVYDYCQDNCGNMYGIQQYFNSYSVQFTDLFPLAVSNDARPFCIGECFKFHGAKDEITIKNGKIYTNFKTGSIYLEYLTNLESDSGDLMIPDNETIKTWIKSELRFAAFQKLYLNIEGDVQQRLQWLQQQVAINQVNAMNIYRHWTVRDYFDLRKLLYSRFHKYNSVVYGKGYSYKLAEKLSGSQKYPFDRMYSNP